jgi:hypothetical protein
VIVSKIFLKRLRIDGMIIEYRMILEKLQQIQKIITSVLLIKNKFVQKLSFVPTMPVTIR